MEIREVMTRDVYVTTPDVTIRDAATLMGEYDIGSLLIGENGRLIGIVTDRDIVLRAIAQGLDSSTAVSEIMSEQIKYCYENDSVDEVARQMAERQLRRMPVVDRNEQLVGIVSLANVAHGTDSETNLDFIRDVAPPH